MHVTRSNVTLLTRCDPTVRFWCLPHTKTEFRFNKRDIFSRVIRCTRRADAFDIRRLKSSLYIAKLRLEETKQKSEKKKTIFSRNLFLPFARAIPRYLCQRKKPRTRAQYYNSRTVIDGGGTYWTRLNKRRDEYFTGRLVVAKNNVYRGKKKKELKTVFSLRITSRYVRFAMRFPGVTSSGTDVPIFIEWPTIKCQSTISTETLRLTTLWFWQYKTHYYRVSFGEFISFSSPSTVHKDRSIW